MLHRPLIIVKDALVSHGIDQQPQPSAAFSALLLYIANVQHDALPIAAGVSESRPTRSLRYNMREIELPTVPMASKQSLEF